jgi:general secretion pathway protein E
MIHGESLVMRILDKGAMKFDLQGLGMDPHTYRLFSQLIRLPHGIVLVTGPTGSGKTTTLYSSLLEIRSPENKIITTEDPVEYQLDGINQIQVHHKIGLTFAASLRSILRHDPDIVLVGEIRDQETAENAIQASLTGHLVFSTLHTNDAVGAITRLADLGVPGYLISATVIGVLAQRLARTLCPACKARDDGVTRESLDELVKPWRLSGGVRPYKPVGCLECRHTGFRGRAGLYELLLMNDATRAAVHPGLDAQALRKQAVKDGMRPLRLAGAMKVAEGLTTLEEVLRNTPGFD